MPAALDLRLLRLLRTRGHEPSVERAVTLFSRAGEHGGLWLAIALAGTLVHPAGRPRYAHALRSVLVAYGANTIIKYTVRRRRPVLDDLPPLTGTISGLSYPSAHSAMSFAAAEALAPPLPSGSLHAAAAAMAVSRLYLGVHYPSDALAGAALGWAIEKLVP